MSAFDSAIDGLRTALAAAIPSASVRGVAQVFLGARHLVENGAPPRVVIIPTQDDLVGPRKAGGNPRELFTADTGIALHLWGRSHGEAVDMRDAALAALRAAGGAAVRIKSSGWLSPLQDGWIKAGEVYVLEVLIPLSVTDGPAKRVGRADSLLVDASGAATGDGIVEPGDS